MTLRDVINAAELRLLWRRTQAFASRVAIVVIAMSALDDTPPDLLAAEPEWDASSYWYDLHLDRGDIAALVTQLYREVDANHKIGVEYTTFGNEVDRGALRLGYFHRLERGRVVKLLLGAGLDDVTGRAAARVEFSWPIS